MRLKEVFVKKVVLTQKKVALISDADAEAIYQFKWHAVRIHNAWYAAASVGGTRIYMHRFVLSPPDNAEIDHINGNGLDNRRSNLRICTHAQNLANQQPQSRKKYSRFKGVTWCKRDKIWIAQIKVAQRRYSLGRYDDEADAARAYNRAATKHFGDFARLNDIPEPLQKPQQRTLEKHWASMRKSGEAKSFP